MSQQSWNWLYSGGLLVFILAALLTSWPVRKLMEVRARRRAQRAAGAASHQPRPTNIYLVESFEPSAGSIFFAVLLMFYNLAIGAWFFLGARTDVASTVIALMWIGGNITGGFLLTLGRRRVFQIWRRPKGQT